MSFLDRIKSFFSSNKSETQKASNTQNTNKNHKTNRKSSGFKTNGKSIEGTVRYFNRSRGYGFIHKADSKDKVFVHISDLNGRIKVGDNVRFQIETTEKGPRARQVTKF